MVMNETLRKQTIFFKRRPFLLFVIIVLCIIFQFYFWKLIHHRTSAKTDIEINYEDFNKNYQIETISWENYDFEAQEIQEPKENAIPIEILKQKINEINVQQKIYNANSSQLNDNSSTIIIIQIHNRINYLTELVQSLKKVRGIENVLVIFSHDFYREDINNLIYNITSFKYMQIFFPYSIQLYPTSFPGTDPRDCPRDLLPDFAKEVGCTNAGFPDLYGHYREAKFTQIKHHWWWKANTLFRSLNVTKYFTGYVVFLEEDNYVTPDLLNVLHLAHKKVDPLKNINIICLGHHYPRFGYFDPNFYISTWSDSYCNIGMAFKRNYWEKILSHANDFCLFDDYNWDLTLRRLDYEYIHSNAIILSQPRVYHTGIIGTHAKNNPDSESCGQRITKIKKFIQRNRHSLFPRELKETQRNKILFSYKSYHSGGWADPRDHKLCLFMTTGEHLEIKQFKMIKVGKKVLNRSELKI